MFRFVLRNLVLVLVLGLALPAVAQHPGGRDPDVVATELASNAVYQQYLKKRERLDEKSAAEHAALAAWCRDRKLPLESKSHYLVAATLEPENAAYQRGAGRTRRGNVWATEEEYLAMRRDLEQARLTGNKWQLQLRQVSKDTRDGKLVPLARLLERFKEPLAIPVLEWFGAAHGEEAQQLVVHAIARLYHQAATDSLIRHALFSDFESVRDYAASQLACRNPVYYVPRLVEYLNDGTVDARLVMMPFGGTNGRHAVAWAVTIGGRTEVEKFDVQGDLHQAAMLLQREREGSSWANVQARLRHQRALQALRTATGQDLADDPVQWREWLANLTDSYLPESAKYPPPRTIVSLKGQITIPPPPPPIPTGRDCFAKGTLVWARRGLVPIEEVRSGDLVYSRDMDNGRVSLQPVVRTTVRPSPRMLSITVAGEAVEATPGHPFRVRDRAWVMARDLKVGDEVKTFSGFHKVERIETRPATTAYCLELADNNTFFVTHKKILVHDNVPVYDLEIDPATVDEK
jgi:hypothetical protein